MPASRSAAAIGAAVALAAGTLALTPSAQAATAYGSAGVQATATVLRANVDASVLHSNVPVNAVLDDVHAPADAHERTLHAKVQVPLDRREFTLLTADVATASATSDRHKSEGYANLVNAKVNLPGLPEPVLQAKVLTARASCEAGEWPKANASLAELVVLGRGQEVKVGQTITVPVPGVGEVRLNLSTTHTTSSTAAATALGLHVDVNPVRAGIAKLHADVVLAHATCETPWGGGGSNGGGSNGGSSDGGGSNGGSSDGGGSNGGGSNGGSSDGGASNGGGSNGGGSNGGASTAGSTTGATSGGSTSGASQGVNGGAVTAGSQTAGTGKNLAETGANSSTPYIAGGAAALLVAGGAAVYVTRRRKSSAARG